MGATHFSGPVFSAGGFVTGTDTALAAVTAATLTIPSSTTTEDYNGRTFPLSNAAGITVTLPAATGTNAVYNFLVSTSVTSNSYKIQTASASDYMVGHASVSGANAANSVVVSTVGSTTTGSDTITMNGSTTGGLIGSFVQVQDIATNIWLVSGSLIGSGAAATPFSAAV